MNISNSLVDVIERANSKLFFTILQKVKKLDPLKAISIFADARGGSTWLSETINKIPNSIIIDEPLNVSISSKLQKLRFCNNQFIPEHQDWAEAKIHFINLQKGNILNKYLCRKNSKLEVLKSKQLIIKYIRGKNLLPWLSRQFHFSYKPIVLVRHPMAVIASQINHPSWNYYFHHFPFPNCPFNEIYTKHWSFLSKITEKEKYLAALWCINNNTILKNKTNNERWISINYENLITNPHYYLKLIFKEWNLNIPSDLFNGLTNPSSTSLKKTIKIEKQLTDWQNKLSIKEKTNIISVLDYFQVDYYDQNPFPKIMADSTHIKK